MIVPPNSPQSAAEQTVAHGAAGRAGSEVNVVRRGPVNGGVRQEQELPKMFARLPRLYETERNLFWTSCVGAPITN